MSGDDAPDPLEKWEVQLRKGSLELAVLAVIGSRSRYGLEIMNELAERGGLDLPEGTLYPLLNRLRHAGWLDAEWVESGGGHPRKYYRVTSKGRRQLVEPGARVGAVLCKHGFIVTPRTQGEGVMALRQEMGADVDDYLRELRGQLHGVPHSEVEEIVRETGYVQVAAFARARGSSRQCVTET